MASLSKSGADGSRWVWIDSDECGWVHRQGGKHKQCKKSPKWASRGCFTMYGVAKKNRKVTGTIMVIREGQGEEQRTNKVCAIRFYAFKQRGNSKTKRNVEAKGKTSTYKYGYPRPEMQQKRMSQN